VQIAGVWVGTIPYDENIPGGYLQNVSGIGFALSAGDLLEVLNRFYPPALAYQKLAHQPD
jgi:hypothetical protein